MPAMAARALRLRCRASGTFARLNHLRHVNSTVSCAAHVNGGFSPGRPCYPARSSVQSVHLWFEIENSLGTLRRVTSMKKSLLVVGLAVALIAAWSVGRVQGQKAGAEKVVFASADQAQYTERTKGVSMAAIWGDF